MQFNPYITIECSHFCGEYIFCWPCLWRQNMSPLWRTSFFLIEQVLRSLSPGIIIECSHFCGGMHFLLAHAKWPRWWNSPNMATPWRKTLFLYMQQQIGFHPIWDLSRFLSSFSNETFAFYLECTMIIFINSKDGILVGNYSKPNNVK